MKYFLYCLRIPVQLRDRLQMLMDWFVQANVLGDLLMYKGISHIFQIPDENGVLRCLFKEFDLTNEQLARNEAIAYLLDHPEDGRRSVSQNLIGFAGVLPTLFVRFRTGNIVRIGVLVEFAEDVVVIEEAAKHFESIRVDQMLKISLFDIRLGNMDRSEDNLLLRADENGAYQLLPIDHEQCFYNGIYTIGNPYWLEWLNDKGVSETFSADCVVYAEQMDAVADLDFIRQCGWEPDDDYSRMFRVYTTFLKKAVLEELPVYNIGLMAALKCVEFQYNLHVIVQSVNEDENFFENVANELEDRLREYHETI